MSSNHKDSDDDSFVEFYLCHHGCYPQQERDQQYVKDLKKARKDSRERRKDPTLEKQYEEWWRKKCGKDDATLLWKEQMRSMVRFKSKGKGKQST